MDKIEFLIISKNMIIALWNVRSGWNVGSIMRTCDALGAELVLCGYTPRPIGKTLDLIKKTAIGAEKTVSWEAYEHYLEVFEKYTDFRHFAIEINSESKNIFDFLKLQQLDLEKTILWFGNEIHGIPDELAKHCEQTLHLPMKGSKESLNIANSVTAVGYVILQGSSKICI